MIRHVLLFVVAGLLTAGTAFSEDKIMQPGAPFHGIRDYRQVMPGKPRSGHGRCRRLSRPGHRRSGNLAEPYACQLW
jgi:hypothetical protein